MTMDRDEIADYQERYDNAVLPQAIARRHFRRMTTPRFDLVDAIIWVVTLVVTWLIGSVIFQF